MSEAPCWYCGSYTNQRVGSAAFCSWDHARKWDDGQTADIGDVPATTENDE